MLWDIQKARLQGIHFPMLWDLAQFADCQANPGSMPTPTLKTAVVVSTGRDYGIACVFGSLLVCERPVLRK